MPLTDTQIRNAKPCQKQVKANRKDKKSPPVRDGNTKGKTAGNKVGARKETPKFIATEKPCRMSDSGGLYLEVDPAGGKYWRFKYRLSGKEKRISLGVFDDVKREFRRLLAEAGLRPIRLYDLRHTAATLAIAAGVSVKVISEQLGHANITFTLETIFACPPVYAGRRGS